jgi:putative hemolysin
MAKRAWARPMLGLLAVGIGFAACSNSTNPSTSATTTTKANATSTTTRQSVTKDTVVPISVPNQPAVRKDVALVSCGASTGGWSAGGTLKNSQGKTETYMITVFFTSPQATDLAFATATVTIDPGKSQLWSAKATFAAPSSVLCVLRGVSVS